jgi:chromosome segregation ATPase
MKIRVDDENEDLDRVLKKQEIENRFAIERAKLRLQASIDQKDRDAVPPPSNDGAIDSLMEQNKKIEEQLAALQKEHARSTAEAKVAAEKQSIKDGRLAEFEATLKQKSKTEEDVQKAIASINELKTRLKEAKKPAQLTAKELAKLYKEFEKELGA